MVLRVSVLTASWLAGVAVAAVRYGAMPADEPALMPRYFLDTSTPLVRRDGICGLDSHPCLDVHHPDSCCRNTQYCYIDVKDNLQCCPIGSDCRGANECGSNSYRCYSTSTISAKASGTPSVTSKPGCCNRLCPQTSAYLCPQDRGGQCCSYGFDCQTSGYCVSIVPPSRTPVVTPVPEGCTTSQISCEDGAGCCNDGYECTWSASTAYCTLSQATGSGVAIVDDRSQGLSEGAKAGIAIGAVFGAGIIIAALTWACIRTRRRRRTATQLSASRAGRPVHDGDMTDLTAPSTRPPGNGLTQDYFGPGPVAGPYTDPVSTAATSPNPERGVPSQPQSPGDITAAVEIDSRPQSPETTRSDSFYATPMSNMMDGRYELHAPAGYGMPRQRSPSLQHTPPNLTPRDELP